MGEVNRNHSTVYFAPWFLGSVGELVSVTSSSSLSKKLSVTWLCRTKSAWTLQHAWTSNRRLLFFVPVGGQQFPELQIRGGVEDKSKIFFHSQHMLRLLIRNVSTRQSHNDCSQHVIKKLYGKLSLYPFWSTEFHTLKGHCLELWAFLTSSFICHSLCLWSPPQVYQGMASLPRLFDHVWILQSVFDLCTIFN